MLRSVISFKFQFCQQNILPLRTLVSRKWLREPSEELNCYLTSFIVQARMYPIAFEPINFVENFLPVHSQTVVSWVCSFLSSIIWGSWEGYECTWNPVFNYVFPGFPTMNFGFILFRPHSTESSSGKSTSGITLQRFLKILNGLEIISSLTETGYLDPVEKKARK